jgi:DNA-binding protein H-NS
MLFAETSDMVAIATAVISLIGTIFTGIMAYLMAKLNRQGQEAAQKVEQVAVKLDTATATTGEKLDDVAAKIEEVHKATNSMKDDLVKKTEAEALARGGVEERARAETRKPPEQPKRGA